MQQVDDYLARVEEADAEWERVKAQMWAEDWFYEGWAS